MGGPLPVEPRWRWAAASRIGTSHQRSGTRKQDAYSVSRLAGGGLCAVVSDGAGSAPLGGEGAAIVCRHLGSALRDWFAQNQKMPDDDQIHHWIDTLRDRLTAAAEKRQVPPRQFAATLIVLAATSRDTLALQIGDSALVARADDRWEALCWPQNGEFASTTYFVTDDPDVRLAIVRRHAKHDAFALFSDGIEHVALEQAAQQPHARFFDPMIKPVDSAAADGALRDLSAALGRYLDGPAICERTDDDKTLVLISRR